MDLIGSKEHVKIHFSSLTLSNILLPNRIHSGRSFIYVCVDLPAHVDLLTSIHVLNNKDV